MSPEDAPPTFTSRLVGRTEVAERTVAFQFEKPPGFRFTAGQFMDVTLRTPKETDAEGNTRAFSIASAPHEPQLTIATRMRDTAFKRNLATLPIGAPVTLAGGMGELVLHDDPSTPAVLLAGGIGITPFRSILRDAVHRSLPHRITLFYSNRRPEDAPFLVELGGIANTLSTIRIVGTMTAMERSQRTWPGETGRIGAAMLARHADEGRSQIHYLAGPPEMVKGFQSMLERAGVPSHDVRAEAFDGY
jgi:ferredoxin-NADP reductase